MFDFDAGKLIIVGIIALIFIPPKDLPRVLRQAGQFVGKMRRMASEFQGQFMDAMREADMADLRKEAQKLADSAKVDMGLASIEEHNRKLLEAVDRKTPSPAPVPSVSDAPDGAAIAETTAETRALPIQGTEAHPGESAVGDAPKPVARSA